MKEFVSWLNQFFEKLNARKEEKNEKDLFKYKI